MSGDTPFDELAATLPPGALVRDADVLDAHRFDQAPFVAAGAPAALARATCTADVQTVLRFASAHRVPVVARGAGSGLSGGANAVDGCIVLSLEKMDRIVSVDTVNQLAVVQPGVINAALRAAANEQGLMYAPDPTSYEFSTIGGNVATNAGGLCCVKYGVTGDSVLALEVVLADGTAIRTGRITRKGVAGLDLTRLFVGSEGTLGVVTEITVRLLARPHPPATLVAFFGSLRAAGDAVTAIMRAHRPSMLELMDQTTIRAVDEWRNLDLDRDARALLIAQSDEGGARSDEEIAAMVRACEEAGATFSAFSSDPADSVALLAARRLAAPALERLGSRLLDDVAVPCARVPDLLDAIERIAEARGVLIGTFGHAGDGNMHPSIIFERGDADAEQAARAAFDDILGVTLDLGGTITGEHGVGLLKRPYLDAELGAARAVQLSIKRALDPLEILNPGKAL